MNKPSNQSITAKLVASNCINNTKVARAALHALTEGAMGSRYTTADLQRLKFIQALKNSLEEKP